jgi:hypothetical protein
VNRFRLRVGPRAIADIDATVAWLAERSRAGAESWLRALDEAKQAIMLAPHSF